MNELADNAVAYRYIADVTNSNCSSEEQSYVLFQAWENLGNYERRPKALGA